MKAAATIFLMGLLLAVIPACSDKGKEKQTGVYTRNPVLVKVQAVQRGDLVRTLVYKGTVFPWKRANIQPDISGRIRRIHKKQGDRVRRGELLAELDTTTLKLRLKQAEAALAVAQAAHKDALLNFNRLKTLYEKTAVSKLQLEKARLALETATTQEKNAAATVDLVKHNLDTSFMRAPFKGIITSKSMEEGDVINPMMGMGRPVLVLMDLSKVKVIVDVPSEDFETISTGQPCTVRAATLKDRAFEGRVYTRNLAADPVSKTFKVEIEVDNPDIEIKTGVFAEAEIEIARRENCLRLPLTALIEEDGVSYVMLYDAGMSRFRKVKVGQRNLRQFEVLEGLQGGELVVIEGNYDLKDGAPITYEGARQ
jgi:RND family efflux transporter MFP subunit